MQRQGTSLDLLRLFRLYCEQLFCGEVQAITQPAPRPTALFDIIPCENASRLVPQTKYPNRLQRIEFHQTVHEHTFIHCTKVISLSTHVNPRQDSLYCLGTVEMHRNSYQALHGKL